MTDPRVTVELLVDRAVIRGVVEVDCPRESKARQALCRDLRAWLEAWQPAEVDREAGA